MNCIITLCDYHNVQGQNEKAELAEFGDIEAIPFSAQNGEGADKIREAIEKYSK